MYSRGLKRGPETGPGAKPCGGISRDLIAVNHERSVEPGGQKPPFDEHHLPGVVDEFGYSA
jgi:hypothetical protein